MKKEFEKEKIQVYSGYTTELLCYTPENNTTLLINYTPM